MAQPTTSQHELGDIELSIPSRQYLTKLRRRLPGELEWQAVGGREPQPHGIELPASVSPDLDCTWFALGDAKARCYVDQRLRAVLDSLAGDGLRDVGRDARAVEGAPGSALIAVFIVDVPDWDPLDCLVLHFAVTHLDESGRVLPEWASKCGLDRRTPAIWHSLEQLIEEGTYGVVGALLLASPAMCGEPAWAGP